MFGIVIAPTASGYVVRRGRGEDRGVCMVNVVVSNAYVWMGPRRGGTGSWAWRVLR